jgi:Asp-tRNA(Asn)/Glu-tRNA(Gln) amidotransferase A subunit family amidase
LKSLVGHTSEIAEVKRSRRHFLLKVSAAALAVRSGASSAFSEPGVPEAADDLLELTAVEAVRAMSSGALTSERYATALLERCAQLKSLNAFIALDPSHVLEQARSADRTRASGARTGALHGLPIPVKDSINTVDYATTGGTPALRNFRTGVDAPLVATLRTAGAFVLGKTNLHELSLGWTSNNLAFGAVRNPYDLSRIPGGSSGGTAAAIAARMAPLGVAEDTEGSIRVPAALCGVTGFRPTTGRYPTSGVIPCSPLFDQLGPHARSVADIGLFDRVVARDGRDLDPVSLKGIRLAVARGYWFEGLDPEVERITNEAFSKLRAAGAVLFETEIPGLRELVEQTTDQIVNHDLRSQLARYLTNYGAKISVDNLVARSSSDVRETLEGLMGPAGPNFVPDAVYESALNVRLPRLRATFKGFFASTGASAIAFPATMVTAPRIGEEGEIECGGRRVSFDVAIGRNITPASTAGLPGLVIPAGIAPNGLPVALEFDGPAGSDRELIALGMTIEHALGHVPPPRI